MAEITATLIGILLVLFMAAHDKRRIKRVCTDCLGTGRNGTCPACNGTGYVWDEIEVRR
jgi:DnaJ-class molecular chaperone